MEVKMQIASLIIDILMALIALISLVLIIIKIFPKIKCYGFYCKQDLKDSIKFCFVNIRNSTIIVEGIIVEYNDKKIEKIPINNIIIKSDGITNITIEIKNCKKIKSIKVIDIRNCSYKVKYEAQGIENG